MAGMVEYCDFHEGPTTFTDDGVTPPDLTIRLPAGRLVAVDAKAPFISFLESLEAKEEQIRTSHLQSYSAQLRAHVTRLGSELYREQFQKTPEFVVLFLPGDTFYGAALEQDPSLIEFAILQNVIIATPTTLISLLRAIGYGWSQNKIEENAQRVSELGRELYDRIRALAEHLAMLGAGLENTVKAYNGAVASFDGEVLSSARKFQELGVGTGAKIEELRPIERAPVGDGLELLTRKRA
jgi:DNA recombination protein RmuC